MHHCDRASTIRRKLYAALEENQFIFDPSSVRLMKDETLCETVNSCIPLLCSTKLLSVRDQSGLNSIPLCPELKTKLQQLRIVKQALNVT